MTSQPLKVFPKSTINHIHLNFKSIYLFIGIQFWILKSSIYKDAAGWAWVGFADCSFASEPVGAVGVESSQDFSDYIRNDKLNENYATKMEIMAIMSEDWAPQ